MPMKPPTPCTERGCPDFAVYRGRCRRHAQAVERSRGSAAARGYDSKWRRESAAWLRLHPVCEHCRQAASEMVDHRVPHKGDMALFWDRSNWAASCISCNSRKCVEQEGGFGR